MTAFPLPGFSGCASLWLLLLVLSLPAAQSSPATPDILRLNNGLSVPCRILSSNDSGLTIEYRTPTGSGLLKREILWTDVQSIDFAMDEAFQTLLKTQNPVSDTQKLAANRRQFLPLLKRPNHPVGELGLVYADALLKNPLPIVQSQALDIIHAIRTDDWNPTRRQAAGFLHLQALNTLKRFDDAKNASRQLLDQPDADPTTAARTHLLLAAILRTELEALEAENPRWEEDDLVRPERERLYHELIDHALYPSLFFGTDEASAAEGLALALATFARYHDLPSAAACARDLLHLYPNAIQAAEAKAFLTSRRLPLEPQSTPDAPEDAPPPPEEPTRSEPQITRRKRYERPPASTKKINP